MDKKSTFLCIGVIFILLTMPVGKLYSQDKIIYDSVYYYLKVDTAGVNDGWYLSIDAVKDSLYVDATKDDYSMWKIKSNGGKYVLVNKMSDATDTIRFDIPEQTDTIAAKTNEGLLKWIGIDFFEDVSSDFLIVDDDESTEYTLTIGEDGEVLLSLLSSTTNTRLNMFAERVTALPEGAPKSYKIIVDTIGVPDTSVFTVPTQGLLFLYADTMNNRFDSLAVSDTVSGNLALWIFEVDTIISDTTYFNIVNFETDSVLAFDMPRESDDTIAYMKKDGELNQWKIPFFIEEKGTGKFMTRDTVNNVNYYLGLKGSDVVLARETSDIKQLSFLLADESFKPFIPDSSIVDSTKIYKVREVKDNIPGLYLGVNIFGRDTLLNEVYANVPDGQFVVSQTDKYSLMSRVGSSGTDSLFVLYDSDGDTIPNLYYNNRTPIDTFEIVPIDYGDIETHMYNTWLGYKYFTPDELDAFDYVFVYSSTDVLDGSVIDFDFTDSLAVMSDFDDNKKYILESKPETPTGAPAIAGIPQLRRESYYLRSPEDSTLYASINAGKLVMGVETNKLSFYLRANEAEDDQYYFIETSGGMGKLLVDGTRHVNLVPLDSSDTHYFTILPKLQGESDNYNYLTQSEFLSIRKGYYEFLRKDPNTDGYQWLTKNYYDYATFRREGESMMTRSGSYTPFDLQLWVDTARSSGINPLRPSFFIVALSNDDYMADDFNGFNITGGFLHVMDSISVADHDEYVYINELDEEFFRANFVKAKRRSANELLLITGANPQARDSIGTIGKNENAINEYRFYLQKTGDPGDVDMFYIVTEAGYGDGGRSIARGYLSIADNNLVYFGPRGNDAVKVTLRNSTVSNEIVKPPVIEEKSKDMVIIGGTGYINIRNAMGQEVAIYNILGQPVAKKILSSDNESITSARGIMIVKTNVRTQKVVVK